MRKSANVFSSALEDFKGKDVFGRGNSKLGKNVLTFSLPAIDTCPGASDLCRSLCYATNPFSYFAMDNVQKRYWRNLTLSRRPDFAEIAVKALGALHSHLVRWHVSGDVYDWIYAGKLFEVITRTPEHQHWLYTRSWREPPILPMLLKIAKLSQAQMWFSCDRETGPPDKHSGARLAYMKVDAADNPDFPVDLVFRVNKLRKKVEKHVNRTVVCPSENGITATTCQQCRVCLADPVAEPNRRTDNRFALTLLD